MALLIWYLHHNSYCHRLNHTASIYRGELLFNQISDIKKPDILAWLNYLPLYQKLTLAIKPPTNALSTSLTAPGEVINCRFGRNEIQLAK